jgi:hypothetical protein
MYNIWKLVDLFQSAFTTSIISFHLSLLDQPLDRAYVRNLSRNHMWISPPNPWEGF